MSKVIDILLGKIQTGGEISPFLFLSDRLELLHADLQHSFHLLIEQFGLDTQSIYTLHDTGESLKIDEVKKFISQSQVRARFLFQVFYIEHFARMTPQAQNACLKFLEEPGEGNIVILTNPGESGILETILSRVQSTSIAYSTQNTSHPFFQSLIVRHRKQKSEELVRYFFPAKLEKQEYLDFLQTLLVYICESGDLFEYIDELQEDIQGILKNNLQAKYIVDKYILRI